MKRAPKGSEFHGVAVCMLNEDMEILIIQRSEGIAKDRWGFPGGEVMPGESLIRAADRCLREKIRVPVDVRKPILLYDTLHTNGKYSRTYVIHAANPRPKIVMNPEKVMGYKWVHVSDTSKHDWRPGVVVPFIAICIQLRGLLKQGESDE
jgi:ADP-ribose pyrophosphatase YjhB (NUDIX family)